MLRFRITALTVLLLSCLGVVQAKVYLVAVGISDYPGTRNDLRLPAYDAKTIAWLYSKNTAVEYTLLINDEATQSAISAAMDRLFAKTGTDDIVVFFFSGHGYPGGFVAYDGKMDYTAVRQAMTQSASKHKIIFADACFSGNMSGNGRNSNDSITSAKQADVMLFLSSRSNEISIERRGMRNGFFTAALQRGLRGGADTNHDRIIMAKEIFTYVHDKVVKFSHGKQHPVMWGKFSDSMPVMKWQNKRKQ